MSPALSGLACEIRSMKSNGLRRLANGLLAVAAIELAILGSCLILRWTERHDRRLRTIAVVFLGTFAAGSVFNTYSQPQDPQMQINVMPWLAVACRRPGSGGPGSVRRPPRRRCPGRPAASP